MYKFIILFFVAVLFFPSCSQVDPIVDDVCEITQEICYWANLVCENFEPSTIESLEDDKLKSELIAVKEELQFVNALTTDKQLNNKNFSNDDLKMKLIEVRDQLKRIYERQKIMK